MFLHTAYYVIFFMCLLFTLWRMNKYQSINIDNINAVDNIISKDIINISGNYT